MIDGDLIRKGSIDPDRLKKRNTISKFIVSKRQGIGNYKFIQDALNAAAADVSSTYKLILLDGDEYAESLYLSDAHKNIEIRGLNNVMTRITGNPDVSHSTIVVDISDPAGLRPEHSLILSNLFLSSIGNKRPLEVIGSNAQEVFIENVRINLGDDGLGVLVNNNGTDINGMRSHLSLKNCHIQGSSLNNNIPMLFQSGDNVFEGCLIERKDDTDAVSVEISGDASLSDKNFNTIYGAINHTSSDLITINYTNIQTNGGAGIYANGANPNGIITIGNIFGKAGDGADDTGAFFVTGGGGLAHTPSLESAIGFTNFLNPASNFNWGTGDSEIKTEIQKRVEIIQSHSVFDDNPGNNKYFGTDGLGAKEYYDLPSFGNWEPVSILIDISLTEVGDHLLYQPSVNQNFVPIFVLGICKAYSGDVSNTYNLNLGVTGPGYFDYTATGRFNSITGVDTFGVIELFTNMFGTAPIVTNANPFYMRVDSADSGTELVVDILTFGFLIDV